MKKKRVPWDWQIKAAASYAGREIAAIVAHCGTGKTLAGILLAKAKQMPTIVIAPTHRLCEQWKEDIKEELGDEADVWVYKAEDARRSGYWEEFDGWLNA